MCKDYLQNLFILRAQSIIISTKHHIIQGDSRYLSKIDDHQVSLVITSPPYWQLKDYGTNNQVGFYDSYEDYINGLNLVWAECYRTLEPGCRLCINIGDQFARAATYGRYKVIPIRTEIIKCCEALGFDYMGAIIWQKQTTTNTTGGASLMGSYPNPRNGVISIDYEFILLFKKQGKPRVVDKSVKAASSMTKEEWKSYFSGHWNFGGTRQKSHIAMFPEELPHRLIKMFSFIGETVFDPFIGSGTTALAAKNLGRNSIGYEINPDYIAIIKEKLRDQTNNHIVNYSQDQSTYNAEKKMKDLPYIFHDYHSLSSTIDLRKKNYGSVVDQRKNKDEKYYTVKKIISPSKIKLNNGLIIQLIGIATIGANEEAAKQFIRLKTKSQRVYLRIDPNLPIESNKRYLYLKNRTFINRHLIKHGLCDVDTSYTYKYLQKFIALQADK